MRRPVLASLAALAALSCGGSSSSGGGGGTSKLTATGSIPLQADQFTSVVQSTSCSIAGGLQVGIAFAAIGASDVPGLCGYLQRSQLKQNAKAITIAAIRLNPLGAAALVPDTYPIVTQVTTQEKYALVLVSQTDAACAETSVDAESGSVVITSVDGGRVKGRVDATLTGGGTITGSFDAPACAVDLLAQGNVCTGQLGPSSPTCAQ